MYLYCFAEIGSLFLFSYRNDQVSDEMLLYHMLLTLQSKRNQVWELVVDFTHASDQNRFKVLKVLFSFYLLVQLTLSLIRISTFRIFL